jgi:hypothetical protein
MGIRRLSQKTLLVGLAIASCIGVSMPVVVQANGLPGLTIFGGPGRGNELGYRLDRNGIINRRDRYRLRIPADKMELGANEFRISYPDSYTGEFDPEEIEVRVDGDSLPVDEVIWDEESREIEIYMLEAVPARTSVEIVMSDVRNPRRPGMHFFNGSISAPGDVPLTRYVGTWVINITR